MRVRALHDLQRPRSRAGYQRGHLRPLIAAVGDDARDEREARTCLTQKPSGPIPVLHAGRMHIHVQQKAERIDEDMALAPEDLLACIVADRIERAPPFTAPLALWASIMAVVGLGSRPACSRLWM